MHIPRLHTPHLLDVPQMTEKEMTTLIDLAASLRAARQQGEEKRLLEGKNIALVFEKPSTRTRCAFEVAAHHQGAHLTYIGSDGSHMGRDESVKDTARVLGRMYDAIEFRGFAQETVEVLAGYAGVPVWNGLTDEWHPTQLLADLLTMRDHAGKPLHEVVVTYVGDGRNNVARSLMIGAATMGLEVRIAAPKDLQPDAELIELARTAGAARSGRVIVGEDVEEMCLGADFLYTDVWVSMGEPQEERDKRIPLLIPYRIDDRMISATANPRVKVMHCLPSIHNTESTLGRRIKDGYGLDGAEISDSVFESEHSIVFDQAENRLHTIKAVMVASLAGTR